MQGLRASWCDGARLRLLVLSMTRGGWGAGDVFVAMRGEATDGNRYIDAAVAQGAAAVVTDSREAMRGCDGACRGWRCAGGAWAAGVGGGRVRR